MKIKTLHGLRGLAALVVTIAHLPQITGTVIGFQLNDFLSTSRSAYIAVDIFFILSGFLITKNLLRDKQLNRFSFKNFYIKRFIRLYPIYFLSILLVGIFISWDKLGYVATFTSNYYFAFDTAPNAMRHTWSLAVENHFYIFWPFVIYFTTNAQSFFKKWKYIAPLILLSSFILYYFFLSTNTSNWLIDKSTNTRFISLFLGACIAYQENTFRNIKRTYSYPIFALLCYTCLFIVSKHSHIVDNYIPSLMPILILSIIGSASLFIYIINLEGKTNIANKIFTNKALLYMGTVSYGLYLYHYPIYYINGYFTGVQIIGVRQAVIALALSILASILSYNLIEKRLANKFRPK